MTVVSRSEDTIRQDFRDYINQWLHNATQRLEDSTPEEVHMLQDMAIRIQEPDRLFTKEQAMYSKRRLEHYALVDMNSVIRKTDRGLSVDVMSELDCMTLYADIYYTFLRPGSYSLT